MSLTNISWAQWKPAAGRYQVYERETLIGSGPELWREATDALMRWKIKTRSGFEIHPESAVVLGARPNLSITVGPVSIKEPIEVCDVLVSTDRVGFAYKTLPGHPIDGEEAFILQRRGEEIFLIVRSLSAPSTDEAWRKRFAMLTAAQKLARLRYRQALVPEEKISPVEKAMRAAKK